MNFGRYRKLVVALAGAVVVAVGTFAGLDDPIYSTVVTVLTALGVYVAPNAEA